MLSRRILTCRSDGSHRYCSVTSPFVRKLLDCFSEWTERVTSGEWAFLLDTFEGVDER